MVQIANPIYDAVFKFMMNDNEVAKLLLSAIIGQPIQQLIFQPTEFNIPLQDAITVFRMDFKAIIELDNGDTKTVIIEIQKAKLHTDIMRFRKYLGEQYQDKNNSTVIKRVKAKKKEGVWIEHRKAFPILSIYFLGHSLDHANNIPVIKVARTYYDLATGIPLTEKEDFIESLTHDSYIIQIPYLKGHKRTDLEQLLQIFDQQETDESQLKHILTIQEEDIPEDYLPIVRRLKLAIADAHTQSLMQAEDDIINKLRQYSRALEESNKIIAENKQIIAEKEQTIAEKEQTITSTKKSLHKAIEALISLNLSDQKIANTLQVSLDQVRTIRNNLETDTNY